MILIREITAKELAKLWKYAAAYTNNEEEAAQAVLNSLQVKADVRPMTLPDEAPSSSQSCAASPGASH